MAGLTPENREDSIKNHWVALNVGFMERLLTIGAEEHYVETSNLRIDNNLAERAIKPFVIGR